MQLQSAGQLPRDTPQHLLSSALAGGARPQAAEAAAVAVAAELRKMQLQPQLAAKAQRVAVPAVPATEGYGLEALARETWHSS